jgi:hypothetical protein
MLEWLIQILSFRISAVTIKTANIRVLIVNSDFFEIVVVTAYIYELAVIFRQ